MQAQSGWQVNNILIPIDGSATCHRALDVAANVAHCNGVQTVYLVHAVDPDVFGAISPDLDQQMIEPLLTRGRDLIDDAAGHLAASGLTAKWDLVKNAPVDAILETAARRDADLVVLATRGRVGMRRILGSIGLSIIAYAPCSVLAIPDLAPAWDIRRILLPMGRSDDALMDPIVQMTQKRNAELLILAEDDESFSKAQSLFNRTSINGEVLHGDQKHFEASIIAAAHQHAADIVISFPRRRGTGSVKIDSRTQVLLHELHCPLLIVKLQAQS